jgi:cyclophilin family peptidyl-prolyl cis-trans isomerase
MADDPAIQAVDRFIAEQAVDTSAQGWRLRLKAPPKLPFDAERSYLWELETSCGNVSVRLLPKVAPMHASSTIYLTRLGFYDGLTFHRVIPGFMAQGGCPRGTGTGGPGYEYAGEFDASERHDRPGLLSMANAGPGTDGSQFFLTFVPTDWLDDKHSIFGEVVDGIETMSKMEQLGSRSGEPSERIDLRKATISVA